MVLDGNVTEIMKVTDNVLRRVRNCISYDA